jgi:hypothetical protein
MAARQIEVLNMMNDYWRGTAGGAGMYAHAGRYRLVR